MFLRWKYKVDIFQEGPEPLARCDQCRMHMKEAGLFKHWQSDSFHKSTERSIRWRDVEMAARFGEKEFSLDGEEWDERVYNVPTFWYLVIPLDQMDDDFPDVRRNIMHSGSVWGRLGTLLQREGHNPRCRKISTGRCYRQFYCMGHRCGSFWCQWQRG